MSIREKLEVITDKIYEKGCKDEEYSMWQGFTSNGERPDFSHAFSYTDFSGKKIPSELIQVCDTWNEMFFGYMGKTLPLGIDVSIWSNAGSAMYDYFFYYAMNLEEIYDLHIPPLKNYVETFSCCFALKKIEKFRVNAESQFYNTFTECSSLTDITILGAIGSDINFQYSPLSIESMKSIISALKNYADTDEDFTHTLTFSSDCWDRLTDYCLYGDGASTDLAPDGDIWVNYPFNKGWNCV